jgi:DNA-nicking Smr family endonuclease
MRARDRGRRRVLSRDERVLWNTFTRSIAPLRSDAPVAEAKDLTEQAPVAPTPPPVPKSSVLPEPRPAPPPLAPLGRRTRARVARGRDAIDARLDLHGLTQGEAHAELLHFLRSASARGARLVLVITGKGRRGEADGERGVLRRQVPQWLGLPEFRPFVVGFEDAHAAHGGEGALYVRVRRPRGSRP